MLDIPRVYRPLRYGIGRKVLGERQFVTKKYMDIAHRRATTRTMKIMRKRRKKRRNGKSIDWMVKSRQMICHIGNALPYRSMTSATILRVEVKNNFRGKDIAW
jgi:hypothetical protein